MLNTQYITHSPKGDLGNEDAFGSYGNIAFAIDGATGLATQKLIPGSESDARWLARTYQNALLELAPSYENYPLQDLVKACQERVSSRFAQLTTVPIEALTSNEYPSATLALVRVMVDRVETALFCDTTLILQIGQEFHAPQDLRLRPLDAHALSIYTAAIQNGKSRDEALKMCFAEARVNRDYMNAQNDPKGYGVLSLHAHTAEMGIYHTFPRSANAPVRGLLATDGFASAALAYGIIANEQDLLTRAFQEKGLEDILNQVRAFEAADPNCKKVLRFKPSDDATALRFTA